MTTPMDGPEITTNTGPDGHLITVAGELDLASAPALAERIAAVSTADAIAVTLDLAGVTFIDSSALRALVVAGRELTERGGSLLIGPRSPVVERVLSVTQLDQQSEVFQVLPDPA